MREPPYGYDDESLIARKRLLQLLEHSEIDASSLRAAPDELGKPCRQKVDELLQFYEQGDSQSFKSCEIQLKQMLELQRAV